MATTTERPQTGRGHFDLRELSLPPERSRQQRMAALARANDVRSQRAQLKRDLKAGRVDVVALLARPPECIETMSIVDLLLATPRIGRVRANVMLAQARVSPSKWIGGLSARQRDELACLLRAPTYPMVVSRRWA